MAIVYPLNLPATPGPRNVEWSPVSAVAAFASPFTLQQQVQIHQGQLWQAKFELPSMDEVSAAQWIAFLLKLNGRQGTFLFGDSIRKTPLGSAGGAPVIDGGGQTGQSILTRAWPVSTAGNLVVGDWLQIGSSVGSVLSGVFSAVPSWGTDFFITTRSATQVAIQFTIACPLTGGTLDWEVGASHGVKNINPGAAAVSIMAGTGTPRLHRVLNNVDSDGTGDAIIDIWPRVRESPDDGSPLFLTACKGMFRLKDNMMDWNIGVTKRYGMEIECVEAS